MALLLPSFETEVRKLSLAIWEERGASNASTGA